MRSEAGAMISMHPDVKIDFTTAGTKGTGCLKCVPLTGPGCAVGWLLGALLRVPPPFRREEGPRASC